MLLTAHLLCLLDLFFQETVGFPMGIYRALLLADFVPYSYEADCIQELLKINEY